MTTTYTIGKNVSPQFIVGGNSLTFSNNGINWYQSATNISLSNINTLEYNGTVYVAGGSGTTDSLAYSDNGTTWYSGGNTITICNEVKWGGYGPRGASLFLAVGSATNGNSMAYSLGGLHWIGERNVWWKHSDRPRPSH
jgi:hypothetical protein